MHPRMARKFAECRVAVLTVGVSVLLTACSTTRPAAPAPADGPASRWSSDGSARRTELVNAARSGKDGAWDALAGDLTQPTTTAADVAGVVRGLGGHEERLLEALLNRARFLADDVSPVLRRLGEAVGRSGRWEAWRAAVREVSGRECCMTRRFLAAAMDGLADGLAAAGVSQWNEPETALRVAELARHHDPEVAAAAGRLARVFPVPERAASPQ